MSLYQPVVTEVNTIPFEVAMTPRPITALKLWRDSFGESWPGLRVAYPLWKQAAVLRAVCLEEEGEE